ncbi:catalase-like domain-containing protein [Lipomyces tetrasporus]|uniref:Catalase n=1 Tax=Lipomyces tetrasporus TaxID=54092 RepID=A0AAD7QS72_9ASCO|nr:catalase-like domain-containing protein [Lipomyces tetrasporus]KAJ8098822.1 catalase-like domain-containing protein [Lipomyces tetrasporus]
MTPTAVPQTPAAHTQSTEGEVYTASNGCPVFNPRASQRVGVDGPLLLQDFHLIDLLAHFDRERIPERVVHAKGAGAYGTFEVTDDISDLTCANFLGEVGKKTKTFTRFSTVGGERASPDSARDPRGFATKLYTEDGVLDWVFNNTPVFFIRDPSKFPLFIHTQKRDPQTNLKDATMFWDYLSTNQESVHQVMTLFSDRGTPYGYRFMHGFSGHTFKFVKTDGSFVYVQIHLMSDQGTKNFENDEAIKVAGENPDFATKDLFDAIERGECPSWTAYVQTMTPAQAQEFKYSVFDLTKVWPHKEFPLRKFGKLTLNKNPQNYFAEVEQAAFSPAHLVPGIEASADPVLQSRLFSYNDTHRHRLGVNYLQIPVNCPLKSWNPFERDGGMRVDGNYGPFPNYQSSFAPMRYKRGWFTSEHEQWVGKALDFSPDVTGDDYEQARGLWNVLGKTPGQQENLVYNVASHLCNANHKVQEQTFQMFSRVDTKLGEFIRDRTTKMTKKHK